MITTKRLISDFHLEEEVTAMFQRLQAFSLSEEHYERGIYRDQQLIGFINDVGIENACIELGYVIHPDFKRRGYATEALAAAIEDLFQKGFRKVVTGAFRDNRASRRVMEKCGMELIDSTWYGGANVTGKTGIPLSLDREEYELCGEDKSHAVDTWSYELGVMDCFCEMVSAGVKRLAMSHPCDTKQERDTYQEEVGKLCEKYEICFFKEDMPLLTPLFPESLSKGKYHYLFFGTPDVLEEYGELKAEQKQLMDSDSYTEEKSLELAERFGRLLSYPSDRVKQLLYKKQ